jgi:Lrp/AsnC family transcriptional regulator, leucine-responsive regulatory protein
VVASGNLIQNYVQNFILDITYIYEYLSVYGGYFRMLDDTGIKILKILQNKARIPNVEVARQVGLAPSAVLERIRKLERDGYIDGYEVRLNPQRFRRSLVGFIHIKAEPGAQTLGLEKRLCCLEEVQEVHFIAGLDVYLVKTRVQDPLELDNLVRRVIGIMPGVCSTQSYIVLHTAKETARIPIDESDLQ